MSDTTVTVLDGATFVVADRTGDLDAGRDPTHGFYVDDTRVLSLFRLRVDGNDLTELSCSQEHHYLARFFLVPAARRRFDDPRLSVIRERVVRSEWVDRITVFNHTPQRTRIELEVELDADFADLFEVKEGAVRPRVAERRLDGDAMLVRYRREQFTRGARVAVAVPPAAGTSNTSAVTVQPRFDGRGLRIPVELEGRGSARLEIRVSPLTEGPLPVGVAGKGGAQRAPRGPFESFEEVVADVRQRLEAWRASAPLLETDWEQLRDLWEQSLADLAALRFDPRVLPGAELPAAGLPWFMALFGRDTLITSYQVVPFIPELAATALRVLAALQATTDDPLRDAEPGKIIHELRFGELAAFGETPHSPYYGSADATPLFLIVLDEYHRWTGDDALVRELEGNARAALAWIDEYGDRDGDGFIEYATRNAMRGLRNQCWKDSWNSIVFGDGSLAEPPIASCEIQGYAYDAKRRCARLAREVWGDEQLASRLAREAEALARAFDDAFWIEHKGFYALALDRDKRRVDVLASNVGHLLWSGIVPPERAQRLAALIMSDRLASGWGVRTLAADELAYNPVGYHNGSVWPHDTALVACGLARFGFRREAGQLACAVADAAEAFRFTLPEVFAGYPRSLTDVPVEYPTSSRPQAWAAGAALLLVRVLMGLDVTEAGAATLPLECERATRIALRGVRVRGTVCDLASERVVAPTTSL
ncbi:glycogen debranching N-terminal domain-containing protein [Thermoleophilum album]|uniref:Glycogen debranching enzyme (Alpha-1,6-glucosidase) n=1 Tax=Thermoleophilum album TaxID=29539 RepID=A0A1H6FW40_THEAL|nr:glycogen debranching N-terminal domain-containing protein [Thermoleophilum album]SEH14014.1 Glycogen debranching enzyme (alpha-1,6-glucosidase) [Thermoleophilum album]